MCFSDPGCDELDCKYYSYCLVPPSGIATCTCPDRNACGDSKNRVCGTDGLSYDNICQLTAAACERYHEVRVRHGGLCIRKLRSIKQVNYARVLMFLTYDLLKDRCISDVTVNSFLLLYIIKKVDSMLPWV